MKKLTGPILLAAALIAHMGFAIATEKDYTFSSSDYELSAPSTPVLPVSESAKAAFQTDDQAFAFRTVSYAQPAN